jgi:BatD DUF11 like domain
MVSPSVAGASSPHAAIPASRVESICSLLLVLLCLAVCARAAEVTAALNQLEIPAGEGAELRIEIKDGRAEEPQVPQVPDFIINQGGREHQMSLFDGVTSSKTVYRYAVGSMKPGDYTIPPFTVVVDGQEFKTQPLRLKVTPGPNMQPPGANQNTPQPQNPGAQAEGEAAGFGFLTVELVGEGDRKHVWLGEIAPVRIKAWFPAESQARLQTGLQPEGSAFTLHNVSDRPSQQEEPRNGRPYVTLTWFAGLSAAKPGSHLPDLNCRARVAIPDLSRGRRGNPFFSPMVQKEVVLSSKTKEAAPIEVRPLPEGGKPDDFTGAVGQFQFGGVNIPSQWLTGEPQQLVAEVTGRGNFALLSQPSPLPAENWRTYSGQSDFSAGDVASFSGTQRFRFNALAKKPGVQGLRLGFSFFNPETGKYETVSTPAKEVEVTGSAPAPAAEVKPEAAPPAKPEDGLAPLKSGDTAVRSLVPFAWTPAFRTLVMSCAGVALAGVLLARVRNWRRSGLRGPPCRRWRLRWRAVMCRDFSLRRDACCRCGWRRSRAAVRRL